MRSSIPSAILTALGLKELRPFILFKTTIDSQDYVYTDCNVPILYDGDLYQPRGLKHEQITYSTSRILEKTRVEVDNIDNVLTPAFASGQARGSDAELRGVLLDDAYHIIESTAICFFDGTIDDWRRPEDMVQMSLVSLFVRWNQKPLTRHGASCRVKKFKGTRCGYSGGSTWCDRTYARCLALANQSNFRGFRWLPSIADLDIWWGRKYGG